MKWNNRLAAAGIMAAVFVSGGFAGGALTYAVGQRDAFEMDREGRWGGNGSWDGGGRRDGNRSGESGGRRGERPRDPRALMESRAVEEMVRKLGLSEAQRLSVESILERRLSSASKVFSNMGPQLRALLDSTNVEIRRTLTLAQQTLFDQMVAVDRGLLGRRYGSRPSGEHGR